MSLHRQMIVWAMRDELDLPVSPLNSPTFRQAKLQSARACRALRASEAEAIAARSLRLAA
jgi:hypothetical protein